VPWAAIGGDCIGTSMNGVNGYPAWGVERRFFSQSQTPLGSGVIAPHSPPHLIHPAIECRGLLTVDPPSTLRAAEGFSKQC